jgi:hypothetical protein
LLKLAERPATLRDLMRPDADVNSALGPGFDANYPRSEYIIGKDEVTRSVLTLAQVLRWTVPAVGRDAARAGALGGDQRPHEIGESADR